MQNLSGKTAFVTGGASGIGLGIAKALKKAGMKVVIADIRQDHLDEAVAELGGGEDVLALKLDVTDRDAYAAAADAAEARFGKIHLLVNNAGIGVVGPVELATYGDWDWSIERQSGRRRQRHRHDPAAHPRPWRRRPYRLHRLDVRADAASGRGHLHHHQGRGDRA